MKHTQSTKTHIIIATILLLAVCVIPIHALEDSQPPISIDPIIEPTIDRIAELNNTLVKAPPATITASFPDVGIIERGRRSLERMQGIIPIASTNGALSANLADDGLHVTADTAVNQDVQLSVDDVSGFVTDGYVRVSHLDASGAVDAVWHQKIINRDGYVYLADTPSDIVISSDNEQELYQLRMAELSNASVVEAPSVGDYSPDDFVTSVDGADAAIVEPDILSANKSQWLNISSSGDDKIHTIRLAWDEVAPYVVDGKVCFNHHSVVDGNDTVDVAKPVSVVNDNGYVYLEDMPFSSLTIVPYGTGDAYVAASSGVAAINKTSDAVVATIAFSSAQAICVSPDGTRVYVGNISTLIVIDTATNTITGANVSGIGDIRSIAVTPNGTRAYISDNLNGRVALVNLVDRTIMKTITTATGAYGVAINNAGTYVYVTNYNSANVKVIATANDTVVATVNVGSSPNGIVVNNAGTRVYVSSTGSNDVRVIDTSSNTVIATITGVTSARGIAINPSDTEVYVGGESYVVKTISTATNIVIASTATDTYSAYSTAVSSDGKKVYSLEDYGKLNIIDAVTHSKITSLATYGTSRYPYTFRVATMKNPICASFTANKTYATLNNATFAFTDTSTNTPTAWLWDFGDGSTSTAQNPTHTYSAIGLYTVSLNASNTYGYSVNNQTGYIRVSPVRNVSYGSGYAYIANYGTLSSAALVSVVNTTDDTIMSTIYVGGSSAGPRGVAITPDGSKACEINNEGNLKIINTATNTVDATVTGLTSPRGIVITPDGTKAYIANTNANTVSVVSLVSNSIVATVNVGTTPFSVDITPDGTKAYVTNSGTTTVSVIDTATNTVSATIGGFSTPRGVAVTPDGTKAIICNYGNSSFAIIDTATNTIASKISGASNQPWNIAISPDGKTAYATSNGNNTISVINISTNAVTSISGVGQSRGITITPDGKKAYACDYGSNIVRVINLTTNAVTSISGFSSPESTGKFICSALAPNSSFTSDVTSGSAPLTVQFTDTSIGSPTAWDWDFGDGTSHGTTQSPSHQYTNAGTYTVVLNASNVAGYSVDTQTDYITVSGGGGSAPVSAFTSNVSSGTAPLSVAFTDTSTNTPTSWAWNFGDGTSNSTAQSPVHQFVSAGEYQVTLGATNDYGTTYIQHNITVNAGVQAPVTAFTSNVSSGTYPLTVAFTDGSSNTPTSWAWNFGDGSSNVTSQNPSHLFIGTGTFHVVLGATNAGGTTYVQHDIVVSKAGTSIVWSNPAAITFGTALSGTQLNAANNISLAGTYVYNPVSGTVLGAGAQTLNVVFTPTDTANYTGCSGSASLTVNKATPSLSWSPSPTSFTYGTGLTSGQLNAGSTPAGTFVYTFGGNTVVAGSIIQAGSDNVTATFTPTDNANYTSGGTIYSTFTVSKYSPRTAWSNPTAIDYPTAISATQLNANANTASYSGGNLAGSFAYNPASGTVLSAGTQTLYTTFSPTDSTNYSTNNTSVSLTINKLAPTITWNNPSDIVFGTALSATQLCATFGGVAGTATYTPASGTVLGAGNSQTLHVSFAPTDSTNYSTVTKDVVINVAKASTTITWANPNPITYGTTLSNTQLNADTGIDGSYTYTPSAGTTLGAGSQNLHVDFSPTDSVNYSSSSKDVSLTVNKAIPEITWNNPNSIVFGTALSSTQLNANSQTAGTFTYIPATGTILSAGSHTLNTTLSPTDSNNFTTATASVNLVVSKAIPEIAWNNPSSITFETALTGLQLDASCSTTEGSFTYTPTSGTILGVGTHTLNVTFSPTDSVNYISATASVQLTVTKASPTLTWNNPQNIVFGTALSGTQLDASASIDGTFAYNPQAGTVLGAGSHTLNCTFTPTDSANYSTNSTSVTIVVTKASTTITWNNPEDITYGTPLSNTQLNANPSVAGNLVYNPVSGAVLSAGNNQNLHVDFTPTDSANYSGSSKNVSINVLKSTPTITWNNPQDINYNVPLSSTQLCASASVNGNYVYTPAVGAILAAGTQNLHVDFTPTDNVNYSTASKNVSIVINKLTPTVSWSTPDDITYGTALSNTQLNPSAGGVAGSFTFIPPSGTVLSAGSHTLSCSFTPTDSVNYTTAVGSTTINVLKAGTTITWNNPAAIDYGTPLSEVQLNAEGSVSGSIVYTPQSGTILSAGTQNLHAEFTPTDSVNYSSSTKNVSIVVNKATPTIDWNNPQDITYGTALSNTQLNANSATAGNFVYTPASGTVMSAGSSQTLHVVLNPNDNTNYTTASKNVTINILKAGTSIAWSNPANITYGTALSNTQLNAQGSVDGSITYIPPSGTVLSVGSHELEADFTPTDASNYSSSTKNVTIWVIQPAPVAGFSSNVSSGTYQLTVSFTDSSTNTPTGWQWNFGDGSSNVTVQNPVHTFIGSGTFHVILTAANVGGSSSIEHDIVVSKATTSISWDTPAAIDYGTQLSAAQLSATGSVAGSVAYNVSIGDVLSAGTHVVHAVFTPTDSDNYSSSSKDVTITVNKVAPSITWNNPQDITYGAPLSSTQLNAQSGTAGTLNYDPSLGTVLGAGINVLQVELIPDDSTNYSTSTKAVNIVVTKADTSVSWENPQDIIFPTAISSVQLNAQGSVPGSLLYNTTVGTVFGAGTHAMHVDFTPTDSDNYTSSSKDVTLTVLKLQSTVNWTQPNPVTYGTPLSNTQLSASSQTAGTFAYHPPTGTVLSAGTHTLYVDFTPTDSANISGVNASVQFVVNKATLVITWSNPANIQYGTPLSNTQLNAEASVAGSFVYDPVAGTILDIGTHQLNTTFTPNDSVNYTTAVAHVSITVIMNPPISNFTANVTQGNHPLTVQFNDNSTGSPATWSWNFGDSTTSTQQNPVHTFVNTGLYTVSLNTTNAGGYNVTTKTNYINVTNIANVASFTQNTTSGVAPTTIQFNDTSIGDHDYWLWNFGDNVGTHIQNPVHTYTTAGNYTVTLEIGGAGGNHTVTMTDLITITPLIITPVANFSANQTTGVAPLDVQFTDNSGNSPISWAWEFGDSATSQEQNPEHVYAAIGNYTVNLTATNSAGSNNTSKVDYIVVTKASIAPICNFTSNATDGFTPFDVQFIDSSENEPTNWLWNFGDNVTSVEESPLHRYNNSGNYTVILNISNSAGSDEMTKQSYINVTETPQPPVSQFYANRTHMQSPEDAPFYVAFTDTSVHHPTTWQWNFGDGQGSTEQNPIHEYTAVGNYIVSLHVTLNQWTSDAVYDNYINISATPVAINWTTDRDSYYAPALVQFYDNTTNYTGTRYWDFGDGTNSTEQNPVHYYANDSVYNVTLTLFRDGIYYYESQNVIVNYVTAGSIKLEASAPDELANVQVSNDTILRLNQTSKQTALYNAIHAVEKNTSSGLSFASLAIIILGLIGLIWYMKYW